MTSAAGIHISEILKFILRSTSYNKDSLWQAEDLPAF